MDGGEKRRPHAGQTGVQVLCFLSILSPHQGLTQSQVPGRASAAKVHMHHLRHPSVTASLEHRKGQDGCWKILKAHSEMFNLGLEAVLGTHDCTKPPGLQGLSSGSLTVKDGIFIGKCVNVTK